MKLHFSLLLIVGATTLFSCKDDDQPAPDPCAGIACANGGTCVNGTCDCPERYTGPSCADQRTPKHVLVTGFTVTDFPATDASGAGWDLTSGADLTFTLEDVGGNVLFSTDLRFFDALPGTHYEFLTAIELEPNTEVGFALWDFDETSEDDFIGGIYFLPYGAENGFPDVVSFGDCQGCNVAFDVAVQYVY